MNLSVINRSTSTLEHSCLVKRIIFMPETCDVLPSYPPISKSLKFAIMGARHFLLAIATLLPAHLALKHPLKDCSEPLNHHCTSPSTTSVPSPSTNNASARISFYVGDASCSSNTILNPEMPKICSDASYYYMWDGKSLTVEETYILCANE